MKCPNCGVEASQDAAECPGCGLVFAKWAAAKARPRAEAPAPAEVRAGPASRIAAILFYPPGSARRWNPWKLGVAGLAAWYFLPTIVGTYRTIAVNWVDILCHEGGHFIFQVTGSDFWTAFGGSFAQLFFPVAFAAYFLRRRERFSAAVVLFWAANVVSHLSWYAGTSRETGPLAYGPFGHPGLHDYHEMLLTLGLLQHDRLVAGLMKAVAIGLGTCAAGYAVYASREPASPKAPASP